MLFPTIPAICIWAMALGMFSVLTLTLLLASLHRGPALGALDAKLTLGHRTCLCELSGILAIIRLVVPMFLLVEEQLGQLVATDLVAPVAALAVAPVAPRAERLVAGELMERTRMVIFIISVVMSVMMVSAFPTMPDRPTSNSLLCNLRYTFEVHGHTP